MAFRTGTTNQSASKFTADANPYFFTTEPKKASIWDRIFGVAPAQMASHAFDQPEFERVFAEHSKTTPHVDQEVVPQMAVWVAKPARTPLDAFKDTISEGTRLFCEQNVYPLYVEDHQTKFRVTGIKMYVPKGESQLTSILEELPIEIRNRLARLRAQAAPGAAEQLVFDESFFGISIDIAPAVIEGQQIRLIAAWSGGSVEIKMIFTGEYISIKDKPVESTVAVAKSPLAPLSVGDDSANRLAFVAPVQHNSVQVKPSKDTPLGTLTPVKKGTDTPMAKPVDLQIALVRLLPHGASQETLIRITTAMLPFMLGRDHTSTGRFANGYSMAKEEDEQIARLVSRHHFELNRFEREESRFYVINHGADKNGSFHNGCSVPERFSFKAVASKNAFVLGGSDGVGTVRIVIEAV